MVEKLEKRLAYLKNVKLEHDNYIIGWMAGRIAELEVIIKLMRENIS